MVSCSLGDDGVHSYEDTCSFACNTGYELTGSNTRTCQSDGGWSGSDTACGRGEELHMYILVNFIVYVLLQQFLVSLFPTLSME